MTTAFYLALLVAGGLAMTRRYSRAQPVGPRFWAKVVREPDTECWWWLGACDRTGYGHMSVNGRLAPAHRIAYEMLVGPIPVGLEIDHLCRNRKCVNPNHLEPVTGIENIRRSPNNAWKRLARQTHCKRGHEFTPENTFIESYGSRRCRTCKRARERVRA